MSQAGNARNPFGSSLGIGAYSSSTPPTGTQYEVSNAEGKGLLGGLFNTVTGVVKKGTNAVGLTGGRRRRRHGKKHTKRRTNRNKRRTNRNKRRSNRK